MITSLMSGLPRRETWTHGPDHSTVPSRRELAVALRLGARPDADDRLGRSAGRRAVLVSG